MYYEKCELRFDDSQKRVKIQISGSGHQLVKLETLGEISDEETVFKLKRKELELIRKI